MPSSELPMASEEPLMWSAERPMPLTAASEHFCRFAKLGQFVANRGRIFGVSYLFWELHSPFWGFTSSF